MLNLRRGHLKEWGRCQVTGRAPRMPCVANRDPLYDCSCRIQAVFAALSIVRPYAAFLALPLKDRLERRLLPNEIDESDTETSLTAVMSVPIKNYAPQICSCC